MSSHTESPSRCLHFACQKLQMIQTLCHSQQTLIIYNSVARRSHCANMLTLNSNQTDQRTLAYTSSIWYVEGGKAFWTVSTCSPFWLVRVVFRRFSKLQTTTQNKINEFTFSNICSLTVQLPADTTKARRSSSEKFASTNTMNGAKERWQNMKNEIESGEKGEKIV